MTTREQFLTQAAEQHNLAVLAADRGASLLAPSNSGTSFPTQAQREQGLEQFRLADVYTGLANTALQLAAAAPAR